MTGVHMNCGQSQFRWRKNAFHGSCPVGKKCRNYFRDTVPNTVVRDNAVGSGTALHAEMSRVRYYNQVDLSGRNMTLGSLSL
jgi:hypothetical protein